MKHTPELPATLRVSEIIRAGPDDDADGWNPIYRRASDLADAAPSMLDALRDVTDSLDLHAETSVAFDAAALRKARAILDKIAAEGGLS